MAEHGELRPVAVGTGELDTRGLIGEQPHGLLRVAESVGAPREEPRQAREPSEGVSLAEAIASGVPAAQRLPAGLDRTLDLVGEVALVGEAFQQSSPLRVSVAVPLARASGRGQRGLEVGGGLAVGADRCGVLPGSGSEGGDHGGVAGRDRVVHETGEVRGGRAPGLQEGERTAVQLGPRRRAEGGLDDEAGQLVAEREPVGTGDEQPVGDTVVDGPGVRARQHAQQRRLDPRRDDRRRIEGGPRRGGQARRPPEDGVAHGGGDRRRGRGEDLGHEEGVARRDSVHRGRVDMPPPGQLGDRVDRQRVQHHAAGGAVGGQVAEHGPQRVRGTDLVVAVGEHDHDRVIADAPRQEPHEIQRRLVGPVDVLEDDDHRASGGAQRVEGGLEQLAARCVLVEEVGDRSPDGGGDVRQRTEGSRGGEGVAPPPHDVRLGVQFGELRQQRRLAHAGLAGHQHDPARPRCGVVEGAPEDGQRLVPLEQSRRRHRRRP